jgi:hypothetical protein
MYRLVLGNGHIVHISIYIHLTLKLSSAPHLPPPYKEKQIEVSDCTGIRKHFVTQIEYLLDEHFFG